jgi:uncharacterized protein YuzE
VKVIYDRETDTLVVVLREGEVSESDELRADLIADYDSEGHVMSLELLNASQHLSEPGAISYEFREVSGRRT